MTGATSILWTGHPLVIDDGDPRPKALERDWEQEVYPIGNGKLGGTLFGEPCRERLQFNVDTAWVGNEDNTGAYQPFGDLYIDLSHDRTYTGYRRELDIARAVQTISYESGGVRYKREAFASRPAGVIALRFTADRSGALSGRVAMDNIQKLSSTVEDGQLVMTGDTSKFWYWQFLLDNPDRLTASRQYASDQNIDLDVEARVCVLHDGGSTRVEQAGIAFEGCDSVTFLLAADTNYLADRSRGWRGEHPRDRICRQIAEAQAKSFDQLLAEHIADYQEMFGRLTLDLGRSPESVAALPTAERVKRYGEQANAFRLISEDPDSAEPVAELTPAEQARGIVKQASVGWPNDRELEVLLYQYARYLMIASSSPGDRVLPANLQGIWCIAKQPPWRCDFHTDVNIQMNYWFTQASNLADCFLPLAHWIDSIREVRKEETQRVFGVKRGWLMRSENGPFGGSTWYVQKGDSAWLCQNLWDQYAFTQDRAYLERYAYPVMKEISEFWVDHLKELPDGTLVAPEGRSPEHGPVGVDGVTYDQCLCWDLFNNTIEASETLGVDEQFRRELIHKRDRLLGPQVGKWGQLQEWMEDIDDPEDDHRHVNHMIGVYPGRQIHASLEPEFAKAAHVGVTARRDHGPQHPGWSRVWKSCLFARLGDSESAYGELVNVVAKKIYGNLWAVHPPFQIDANFGYAAGINEILIQSHTQSDDRGYVIELLPGLPAAWADGSVKGIRARGGFELDIVWQEGRLTHAAIRNRNDGVARCTVRCGRKVVPIELPGEGEKTIVELIDAQ
jgi:alpha-L-fucosidase 2